MFSPIHRLGAGLGWLGFSLLLTACATAPTQELSDAHQAIQAAEQAGAGELRVSGMRRARLKLEHAEQAADNGQFERSRRDALLAKQAAMQSRDLAGLIRAVEELLQEPRQLDVVWVETENLFQQAKRAARQDLSDQVEILLLRVRQQVELAMNQYYLGQADRNLQKLTASAMAGISAWRSRLEQAEAAFTAGDGRSAFEQSARLLQEAGSTP